MSPDDIERVKRIGARQWQPHGQETQPFLTENELQNLTIVGNPIRSIPQSVQQRGATAVIDLLRKRLPECS
jgi:hypothetical protein